MALRILMLSLAWQLFDVLAGALSETLRARGDTFFALWARLAIAWAIFVPGSWLNVRAWHWGDVGAISWIVFYRAALAGVLLWRFRHPQSVSVGIV